MSFEEKETEGGGGEGATATGEGGRDKEVNEEEYNIWRTGGQGKRERKG